VPDVPNSIVHRTGTTAHDAIDTEQSEAVDQQLVDVQADEIEGLEWLLDWNATANNDSSNDNSDADSNSDNISDNNSDNNSYNADNKQHDSDSSDGATDCEDDPLTDERTANEKYSSQQKPPLSTDSVLRDAHGNAVTGVRAIQWSSLQHSDTSAIDSAVVQRSHKRRRSSDTAVSRNSNVEQLQQQQAALIEHMQHLNMETVTGNSNTIIDNCSSNSVNNSNTTSDSFLGGSAQFAMFPHAVNMRTINPLFAVTTSSNTEEQQHPNSNRNSSNSEQQQLNDVTACAVVQAYTATLPPCIVLEQCLIAPLRDNCSSINAACVQSLLYDLGLLNIAWCMRCLYLMNSSQLLDHYRDTLFTSLQQLETTLQVTGYIDTAVVALLTDSTQLTKLLHESFSAAAMQCSDSVAKTRKSSVCATSTVPSAAQLLSQSLRGSDTALAHVFSVTASSRNFTETWLKQRNSSSSNSNNSSIVSHQQQQASPYSIRRSGSNHRRSQSVYDASSAPPYPLLDDEKCVDLLLFECMNLECHLPWPYNVASTSVSVTKYARIHSFLMQVKYTLHVISGACVQQSKVLRHSTCVTKAAAVLLQQSAVAPTTDNSDTTTSAAAAAAAVQSKQQWQQYDIRSKLQSNMYTMLHFARTIHDYAVQQAACMSWQEFVEQSRCATSLRALVHSHDSHVDTVTKKLFLQQPQAPLLSFIISMLQLVLQYSQCVAAYSAELSVLQQFERVMQQQQHQQQQQQQQQSYEHSYMSKAHSVSVDWSRQQAVDAVTKSIDRLYTIMYKFRETARFLIAALESSKYTSVEEHFDELLLGLTFTDFYRVS
jgi:Gamma tubulin complex component C-terminal